MDRSFEERPIRTAVLLQSARNERERQSEERGRASTGRDFFLLDILLASIDHTDDAEFHGHNTSAQNIMRIGPSIHQIEFRQNT